MYQINIFDEKRYIYYYYYFRIPPSTSRELTDLIVRILKRNPKERIDYDDFFNHPFLNKSKNIQ